MDERLNLEKKYEPLIERENKQELSTDSVNLEKKPLMQTTSKDAGKRMGQLREGMKYAVRGFREGWEKGFKTFAEGKENGEKKEKRSATAIDLMDSFLEMNEVTKKNDPEPAEALEKMFALSQAADNYCVTHKKKFFMTDAGATRYLTAKMARDTASWYLQTLLSEDDKREIYNNEDAETVLGESEKSIEKSLKQAAKAYHEYRVSLAENCMGYMPGGETLHRKLRVLRVSERLIKLYRRTHSDETKRDKLINEMIKDYEECLGWEKLRTLTKQKEESFDGLIDQHLEKETEYKREERVVPADSREGLRTEQIRGIEQIDNWLIKNYKAGSNEDMEMLDRLFSLSKRERLHIYYLIENKRRRDANMLDVAASQTYKPTLDGFTDKIVATKFKFWKRLGGEYIYSHKLSDALLVTREYRKEIEAVAEIDREQKLLKKKEEEEDILIDEPAEAMQKLLELRGNLEVLREIWEKIDNEKTEKGKEKYYSSRDEACEKCKSIAVSLRHLQDRVPKEKINIPQGEDRGMEANGFAENYSIFGYLPNLLSEKLLGGSFELGTEGIVSLIYAVTGTIILVKNGKNYSREDLAQRSLEVGFSAMYAASTGVMIASKFAQAAPLAQTASVMEMGVPVVGALVTAGVAICQGVSAAKMKSHGKNAYQFIMSKRAKKLSNGKNGKKKYAELNKEEQRELKYEANMWILQDKLKERQKERADLNGVAAGLCAMSAVLPILLIPTLAVFIVGGVQSYKRGSDLRSALFDDFFNMDQLAEDALTQRERGERGQHPYHSPEDREERKKQMKEALRLRVAARAGFNSVHKATEYICLRFARLIRQKLFPAKEPEGQEQQEEQNGYIELVKALNLKYDKKKKIPEEHILARRLNAQG